ncbi:hypothetical protein [Streptomyces bugieae]|uniref:DUF3558 domain-containing protein n=1 Tax=Streptomyces bugieae TaxID=3098223 RepID=A0ABU7NXI6_9ACTN|nr:hypothetical protein [Streptomyces sp. DSM 41528]
MADLDKTASTTTRCQRAAAPVAAVSSLILLASGCGGPQVNYALPKDLCGIPVHQDLIRPFFPPGDRIEFDGDSFLEGKKAESFCQYYVDGNTALAVDATRSSQKDTALQLAARVAKPAHLKVWKRADGHIAGYGGTVYGTSSCSESPSDSDGQPARTFTLRVSANHVGSTQSARLGLEKVMSALLPGAAHARGC